MRKETCSNCGAAADLVRGPYRFDESGLKNVVLLGVEMIRCPKCGNQDVALPRVNKLVRALALAVVSKPYRLNGNEVRFLRKYLGMSGEGFARLLHVEKTTLSKWENDAPPIGQQSDLLVRTVVLSLGEGLQSHAGEVVRRFEHIRKPPRSTVRLEIDPETMDYQYA